MEQEQLCMKSDNSPIVIPDAPDGYYIRAFKIRVAFKHLNAQLKLNLPDSTERSVPSGNTTVAGTGVSPFMVNFSSFMHQSTITSPQGVGTEPEIALI